jgi:hypothetical protein
MSKYDRKMFLIIALGVFMFSIVDLTNIANHPEIWSPTYVLVTNIISKILGAATTLFGLIMFVFFESKDNK